MRGEVLPSAGPLTNDDDYIYPNGIDGDTGKLLIPRLSAEEVAALAEGQAANSSWLQRLEDAQAAKEVLGPPPGSDNLAEAGWAYIVHRDAPQEVRDALEALAEHRRSQIAQTTRPERVSRIKAFEYDGSQSLEDWLAAPGRRVGIGEYKPARVPYYLLIAGDPQQIPYDWSLELDLDYAVGRIHFDHASEYKRYVQSIIDYETGRAPARAEEAVFFGTCHKFDRSTQMSASYLIDPLANGIPEDEEPGVAAGRGFATRVLRDAAATRSALEQVLAPPDGAPPPAFLFTATHGVGYRPDRRDEQLTRQGALVCQGWGGSGPFLPEHTLAAADLPENARVHGLIAFLFACYSGGTPCRDAFCTTGGAPTPVIAEQPFMAALPKALLSHGQGGALACIGHTERAWTGAFYTSKVGALLQPFQFAIQGILEGKPVGYAVTPFLDSYSRYGHNLNVLLKNIRWKLPVDKKELARTWTRYHDMGGFMVIGDPFVRLYGYNAKGQWQPLEWEITKERSASNG